MHDAHYSKSNPHGPYGRYRDRPQDVKPSGRAAHEGFSTPDAIAGWSARATANSSSHRAATAGTSSAASMSRTVPAGHIAAGD
jgi:hypothetical protein